MAFERGCDGSVLQSLKCVLTETCCFKSRILISFQFTLIVVVMIRFPVTITCYDFLHKSLLKGIFWSYAIKRERQGLLIK